MYSPAMSKEMAYSVYTPPNWTKQENLPLLVLLHGARDDQSTFDRYRVGEVLDKQIAEGLLPRLVIVNPDGGMGFWENWYDGSRSYRDWVVKDLMPVVQSDYNTKACPDHCYVSGLSMGGHGAIRFAYYEPEMFSSVASISAPILNREEAKKKGSLKLAFMKLFIPFKKIWGSFDGGHQPKDLNPYISWVEKEDMQHIKLMLAWGDQESDDIIGTNTRFSTHLKNNNRDHETLVYPGGHKWVYWKDIIAESIRFHTQSSPKTDVAASF